MKLSDVRYLNGRSQGRTPNFRAPKPIFGPGPPDNTLSLIILALQDHYGTYLSSEICTTLLPILPFSEHISPNKHPPGPIFVHPKPIFEHISPNKHPPGPIFVHPKPIFGQFLCTLCSYQRIRGVHQYPKLIFHSEVIYDSIIIFKCIWVISACSESVRYTIY